MAYIKSVSIISICNRAINKYTSGFMLVYDKMSVNKRSEAAKEILTGLQVGNASLKDPRSNAADKAFVLRGSRR